MIVPFTTLSPPINEDEILGNMDVVLLSEDYDDAKFEVSFGRIHTPRSSTKTSTDSPGSKLKKI